MVDRLVGKEIADETEVVEFTHLLPMACTRRDPATAQLLGKLRDCQAKVIGVSAGDDLDTERKAAVGEAERHLSDRQLHYVENAGVGEVQRSEQGFMMPRRRDRVGWIEQHGVVA